MEEVKTTYKNFLQPRDAWDALSMKEKAEMIGVAVRNGITNLNDIKEKYNEFAEGGNIYDGESQPSNRMVTTGGTGHIPDNYGQGSIDAIRRRLYRNITPFGYHNPISRTLGAVVLNQQDDTRSKENKRIKDSDPEASALDAIWATYLNIPENQRRNINSKYGISKTKDGYYRFNNPGMIFNFEQDLSPRGLFGLPGRKAVMMSGILGNYTTGLGRDTRGDYIFYSDSRLNPDGTPNIKTGWDINPYSNTVDADTEETTEEHGQYGQDKKDLSYKIGRALFENVEDISMGIGTPVPIYDKVYLDDIYDVPGKERGGYYLPEITVYGSKHSLGGPLVEAAINEYRKGGSIYIKPSHRGRLTELKKKTGKTEAELYRTGGPAVRKMITFARNARKWKHGLGGNLFLTGGPTQDNDPATKDWEHRREHDEVHPMYQRTQKDEEYWKAKQERNAKAAEELNRRKGAVMSALEEQANSTPFTGEGYKQAVNDQRQRALDKAKDFEKGARAVVTAAELGLSGASLLGAYANWKNWANAASLTKRGIANLLQKAQAPMQEAGALIDGYQTMDALGNNEFDTYYNGASGILGVAGTIGASDIFRGRYPMVDRFLDTSGIIQNAGDFIKFGYDALHNNTK